MSAFVPAVIVFEKSPRWEAELKRRLADDTLRVRPCRSSADALELCRQAPGSAIVLDLAAGAADVLQLLEALLRQRLPARPIVVSPAETAELEWPARELGAIAYVTDRIGGDALAEICRQALPGSSTRTQHDRGRGS